MPVKRRRDESAEVSRFENRFLFARVTLLILSASVFGQADNIGIFQVINVPGALDTQAFGINDNGQISGDYLSGGSLQTAVEHGFILANGVFSTIDVPGSAFTGVSGINNAGDVVGEFGNTPTGPLQGFSYDGTTFSTINYAGAAQTQAIGINDGGQIVGAYYQPQTAFSLSGSTDSTIIPPMSSSCGHAQVAYGINDSGAIVGSCANLSAFVLSGSSFTAFSFPSAFSTVALGIGADGTVVGSYQAVESGQNNSQGFVYSGGQFQTVDVPGAEATYVSGINDQGDLVGFFYDSSGVEHGFETTPVSSPEPSSLPLLIVGVGALFARRLALSA